MHHQQLGVSDHYRALPFGASEPEGNRVRRSAVSSFALGNCQRIYIHFHLDLIPHRASMLNGDRGLRGDGGEGQMNFGLRGRREAVPPFRCDPKRPR